MHGLVSLLVEPHKEMVENLWKELEDGFDLTGIHVTPLAHFSWQIAEDYDFEQLETIIAKLAGVVAPFTARTGGIGLFSGVRPVIYIPVVKDALLLDLHAAIWEETQKAGHGFSPYYLPKAWMPHISLAYNDITYDNIGGIMQSLVFRRFEWELSVDNIALIYEPEGEIGTLKFKHKLHG